MGSFLVIFGVFWSNFEFFLGHILSVIFGDQCLVYFLVSFGFIFRSLFTIFLEPLFGVILSGSFI